MKIIHVGDLHIRVNQDKRYRQDLFHILRFIVDTALQIKPDYVFIAGDVFDTKIPNPTETAIATAFIKRLLDTGTQIIIIAGNHDIPAQRGAHHTLSAVENLKIDRLYILPEIGIYNIGDIDVLAVPYTYFDKKEALNKITELHNAYTGHNLFTLMHIWIEEYLPINNPREFMGTKKWLQSLNKVKYHALGHIHLGGQILPNAYYSGSPFRITMGEKEPNKYFMIYDNGQIYKVNTPALDLTTIDIKNLPDLTSLKDHICRLVAKDITVEGVATINTVKKQLEDQGNFVYTDIEFKTVQFSSTQESKQQTFNEFIDDYIKKNDLKDNEKQIRNILNAIVNEEITQKTSVFDIEDLK